MSTILVTVDALRPDHLSQYGYERETLPALDHLTREGTLFESAYANGPNSPRSIPSFLTSQYDLSECVTKGPTVATPLSDAGITTAAFHSNAAVSSRYDTIHGFDHYEDYIEETDETDSDESTVAEAASSAYQTVVEYVKPIVEKSDIVNNAALRVHDAIIPPSFHHSPSVYVDAATLTDDVINWIDEHEGEEFFLWVHYMDPHRPYGLDADPPAFAEESPDPDYREHLMATAPRAETSLSTDERDLIIDLYDSDIRYLSTHLDRLFQAIKDREIWNDSTIALTADHGEEFWEHGNAFHRNRPYDEIVHVPLVVKSPSSEERPETITTIRELADIAPTLCEAHGVSPPSEFVGTNLFEGESRNAISIGSFQYDQALSIRTERWTYIWSQNGNDDPVEELYDRNEDPQEQNSVAASNPDTVKKLRELIPEEAYDSAHLSDFTYESEEMKERLESLGYLD